MQNFKNWLVESASAEHNYEGRTPHHIYNTESGHEVHVHIDRDEHGNHAVFINKHLGDGVVKTVHWRAGDEQPTKQELEKLSAYDPEDEEEKHVKEEFLSFKSLLEKAPAPKVAKVAKAKPAKEPKKEKEAQHVNPDGSLSINAGGVVTELATLYHLNEHKHKMAGTLGSKEHLETQKAIQDSINKITKGANKDAVQTRIYHGRSAAAGIIRDVRQNHGNKARIINVGHTSKAGDISRFTRGTHNDTQENTADVAAEIANSHKKSQNSDNTHFHGWSLKSSKKSAEITAKNPGANMDGILNHSSREFKGDEVGRAALSKFVHKPMGLGNMERKEREAALNKARAEHEAAGGEKNKSPFELKANEGAKKAIMAQNNELHDHLKHLASLPKSEGHKMIGKMLTKHLMPDTDMPNSKVKVSGEQKGKIRSVVEPNSEHPLKKLLSDPKTKFDVRKNPGGGAVHVGFSHPKTGEFVHLATYAAKPKSNASKENTMGWNVKAAKFH